ncbi:MAG: glycosyltransferase family 4 protein [Edaphobacter sp.]|uniref:glycosyltransferase family 4 protein n=1 Tax=Edaphobacter sp. TaxID=1934404 RepID=UPI0023878DAA|nr:glycosyltransferase family 4 protein [Edaphobacter sp.]MDE1178848.1 glycosyltransferase family 4 protein [Edaphobacter sp.]
MERPRIGVVMPLGYQQGGAENLLLHWLEQGSERYTLVCAFLQDGPMVDFARNLGLRVEVIPATRLTNAGNYLKTVLGLRRWIKNEKLALVFSWMPKAHLYVAPASLGTDVPLLWFQHGIPSPDKLNRIISRLPTDGVLCCSKTSQVAQRRLSPVDQTIVCYPGVPFPAVTPSREEARARLGISPEARVVGMVARWERWKGVHVFLEAIQRSAETLSDVTFFVAGGEHPRDPGYAAELRQLADKTNLGQRLRLLGQIPSAEVPQWLAAANLIVHPATGPEPFGMAVVEAMGMGRVVIASNQAGPAEIIQNEINGLLVPPGDAAALAAAIERMLTSPEQLRTMSEAAYTRGRSFSVAQLSARLDEVISGALTGRKST